MRIVRPYGRSAVRQVDRKRVLIERTENAEEHDFGEFVRSHDEVVIAQWISIIDKIAAKPTGNNKPTTAQRALRKKLGDAAWRHLVNNHLLPGLAGGGSRLGDLWNFKVEPYPQGNFTRPERSGNGPRSEPNPKGRWYERFAGSVEPDRVEAAKVAEKIHKHLHEQEYRLSAGLPAKRAGLVAGRAASITDNVLKETVLDNGSSPWSQGDRNAYRNASDVAAQIWAKAKKMENGRDGKPRKQSVFLRHVGPLLYEHYGRLFQDGEAPLSIKDAKERKPGLLALHDAVKDVYRRRLSGHKSIKHKSVARTLPANMDALLALVDKMRGNRDLNALVRLGKILHYEAGASEESRTTGATADQPIHVVSHWPADVSQSRYWTSEGQAEIKRNEVFVRIWRHVLALAARTLTDWADPEGKQNQDILGSAQIHAVTGNNFCRDSYRRKLPLLFGEGGRFFMPAPAGGATNCDFEKRVLTLALKSVAELRNQAFHFKGLDGFVNALESLGHGAENDVLQGIRDLWRTDHDGRAKQLRQAMQAAHFEYFFDEAQNRHLYCAVRQAVSDTDPADIPLPRFNRLLRRARNVHDNDSSAPKFPEPVNRSELGQPPRLCRYTAMKLVYERPFRKWLAKQPAATLNGFIDSAVKRTTEAARRMHPRRNDEGGEKAIHAKAEKLGKLDNGEMIRHFLSRLSAETASEMRVQRGYDRDPDKAREQASYIEDLGLDVIGLAFDRYLKDADFGFLRSQMDCRERQFELDSITEPSADIDPEDWQLALYFLTHLVPVDEIAGLCHQVRKWEILAIGPKDGQVDTQRDRVLRIQAVFDLYLDMHDSKFTGGSALTGVESFKKFFQSDDLFDRVFPQELGQEDDRRIPRRGLREIMRFGHLQPLQHIFEDFSIVKEDVQDYEDAEKADLDGQSTIALQQKKRETLHEKWAKNQSLEPKDLEAYVRALVEVVHHRHVAAHVTLTNHVRVHRLMMAVLGRLVDFAGLWERDLYFVTLALMHRNRCRPCDVFNEQGRSMLSEGRIIEALRNPAGSSDVVREGLQRHFDSDFLVTNHFYIKTRNRFAHFNMLQPNSERIDLTREVNHARRLMSYDRKLKNSVSKSITELLNREGLTLKWDMTSMDHSHQLKAPKLGTGRAQHLGKTKLHNEDHGTTYPIEEDLHGRQYLQMIAELFKGVPCTETRDVCKLDLDKIAWTSTQGKKAKGGHVRTRKDKPDRRQRP